MNRITSFGAALGIVLASAAERAEATEYILTLIDYPGATETQAFGINDSGQIVGYYYDGVGDHAFTLSGGVYTSFDHPDAVISGRFGGTGAYGINNSGQIVGAYDASDGTVRAYLRDGDSYVDLAPFGSSRTWASTINDSGMIAGYHQPAGGNFASYVFDGTSYIEFTDPNAADTYAWGINNAGVIVGSGWESTGLPHAFVRDANGSFTNFYIGGFRGGANGINDLGQIVGGYGPGPDDHWGFVLTGGVDATPDKLVPPGATATDAQDINNLGQVVGRYRNGTWPDSLWRSFLATPIAAADFDKDGDVDGTDLILWQGDYGLNANCDADGDGDTDGRDFLVWQRQFGGGVPSAYVVAAVPEPATFMLLVIGSTTVQLIGGKRGLARRRAAAAQEKVARKVLAHSACYR